MSLLQFLQQTILKDVSHQIVDQIQLQHTATQSLLDALSIARLVDRSSILHNKLLLIRQYYDLHQSINRALNGLDTQWYDKWAAVVFSESSIIYELARVQRSKIENKIVRTVQLIFMPDGQIDGNLNHQFLNQLILKLNYLIECEKNKVNPSRQTVEQVSKLEYEFACFKTQFDDKVKKFSETIEDYLHGIKQYELTVRKQFEILLQSDLHAFHDESPFKQLEDQHKGATQSKLDQATFHRFDSRSVNHRPNRHLLYYDQI